VPEIDLPVGEEADDKEVTFSVDQSLEWLTTGVDPLLADTHCRLTYKCRHAKLYQQDKPLSKESSHRIFKILTIENGFEYVSMQRSFKKCFRMKSKIDRQSHVVSASECTVHHKPNSIVGNAHTMNNNRPRCTYLVIKHRDPDQA